MLKISGEIFAADLLNLEENSNVDQRFIMYYTCFNLGSQIYKYGKITCTVLFQSQWSLSDPNGPNWKISMPIK